MFETSRPQPSRQGRLLFLKLLPVSVGVHAAIAGAILLKMGWTVAFPAQPPRFVSMFRLESTPPPPPPPPPPAARPQQVVRPQPVEIPKEIVAPTTIPDTIPVVADEPPPPPTTEGVVGGVEGGVEGGELGGVVGGVEGGVLTDTAPPPPPPPDDGRVHIGLDKPLPLDIVDQPYPEYPGAAVKAQIEDRLAVRYVIGKNGRVQSVVVIMQPKHEMFVEPTLRAIKTWRFRPMVVDGERREVVHELTVRFKLNRRSG